MVGAPFAQSSQRGLKNAGAVYGCETDQNTCAEIFFDRKQGAKNFKADFKTLNLKKNNILFLSSIYLSLNYLYEILNI